MLARLRKTEDLFVTLACFGVVGAALAFGMWVAGHPLSLPRAEIAATAACSQVAPCSDATLRFTSAERRK